MHLSLTMELYIALQQRVNLYPLEYSALLFQACLGRLLPSRPLFQSSSAATGPHHIQSCNKKLSANHQRSTYTQNERSK
jgi:hypothetical protein